jgi:hypothetical protein
MLTGLGARIWMRARRWYRRNARMLGFAGGRPAARRRRPPRRPALERTLAYWSG